MEGKIVSMTAYEAAEMKPISNTVFSANGHGVSNLLSVETMEASMIIFISRCMISFLNVYIGYFGIYIEF